MLRYACDHPPIETGHRYIFTEKYISVSIVTLVVAALGISAVFYMEMEGLFKIIILSSCIGLGIHSICGLFYRATLTVDLIARTVVWSGFGIVSGFFTRKYKLEETKIVVVKSGPSGPVYRVALDLVSVRIVIDYGSRDADEVSMLADRWRRMLYSRGTEDVPL